MPAIGLFWFNGDAMSPEPRFLQIGVRSLNVARELLRRYPQGRVAIVEADPDMVETLRAAGLPDRVEIRHAALSDSDGPVTLYRYGSGSANSLFRTDKAGGRYRLVKEMSVSGLRLDTILDACGMATCDLALLNCEGGELHALRALIARPELADRLPQICMATHWLHYPCYPREDLDDALWALREMYAPERRGTCRRGIALEYVLLQRIPAPPLCEHGPCPMTSA